MGLLGRRLCYLLSSSSTVPRSSLFSSSPHHLLLSLLRFTTTTSQDAHPTPTFQVEYLINSCGLSPDRAAQACKYLAHLKSLSKPTSVLRFLKQFGFGDEHIRKTVSSYPRVLCASVDNTLKPRIMVLQQLGFSDSEIIQMTSSNPFSLICGELKRRIEFWRPLLETNEELLKAIKRNRHLFTCNLGKRVVPNILLLRDCGISECQIGKILLTSPWLITGNLPSLKSVIQRAEDLGVPRGSGMFLIALRSVSSHSRATVKAKFKFLMSLGWSEADVAFAISKAPFLLDRSEKCISEKMNFLKEVGCELQYVARRPGLLTYSLNRRMIPRYGVLKALKANNLPEGDLDFYSAVMISEGKFLNKFVLPHEDRIPGLYETYVASTAGEVPVDHKF